MSKKNVQTEEAATMEQPAATFQMMPLTDILEDPHQPRKRFDETDLAELIQSVKEHGILQPIMIRDCGTTLPFENSRHVFTIVCGARRFRAAEAAGLKEIPVVIRSLSDDQAVEIQIIENLQRKDVNPMEEANAFVDLKGRGFTVEEMALKVGKSGVYVTQRMKLADLVEGFQEYMYAGRLRLTDAFKLCRFAPDIQNELCKSVRAPKDWQKRKSWSCEISSWLLDEKEYDLKDAPFDLKDPDLYPDAGACIHCPHNSASNKLLFPDLNGKKICHNSGCFIIKTKKNYAQKIETAIADPDILFVSMISYPDKQQKEKIKVAQELGAIVIEGSENFDCIMPPDKIETWEQYLEEENDEWSDDMTKEQKNNALQECKEGYARMQQEYDDDLKEYKDLMAAGKFKKAFVVNGNWEAKEGAIIPIRLTLRKGAKITAPADAKQDIRTLEIEQEISTIEGRRERNGELDREKVFKRVMKDLEPKMKDDAPLLMEEKLAMMVYLFQSAGYEPANWLKMTLQIGHDYTRKLLFDELQKLSKNVIDNLFNEMIRRTIFDKLVINKCEDFKKYGAAAAIYQVACIHIKDTVVHYGAEQAQKAEKREKNVTKRIEALNQQKNELLQTDPEPKAKKKDIPGKRKTKAKKKK